MSYGSQLTTATLEEDPQTLATQRRQQIIELVRNWDLTNVRKRVIKIENVPADLVTQMEEEYRRFMTVCAVNPGMRFPISKEVDPFWHAHILFTVDYDRFCRLINNGHFIHHHPAADNDGEVMRAMYLNNMLPKYGELFGEPNSTWWPKDRDFVHCSHGCGVDDRACDGGGDCTSTGD